MAKSPYSPEWRAMVAEFNLSDHSVLRDYQVY